MTALGIGNRGKAEDGGFPSSSHCHLTSFEIATGRDLRLRNPEQIPGEAERNGIKGVGAAAPHRPALGEVLEAELAQRHRGDAGMREDSTHEGDVLEIMGFKGICM